jgi:hypothetical protein
MTGCLLAAMTVVLIVVTPAPSVGGDHPWGVLWHKHFGHVEQPPGQIETLNGGHWLWMRSPEQEKTVVMNLFNRYCIRCHGVDGRGVWDIPGIPDFTDVRWQNYRTDPEIARIIIEGRGAVMPQFRGAIALDEAYGLAHYLRSFVPGTEMSKPVLRESPGATPAARPNPVGGNPAGASPAAAPRTTATVPPPNPGRDGGSPFAR